ncbi:AAA family ATPase [Carnobacterium sp. TMP28]|uniref:ParA family protein n=1 Tax=Carnobacterium sp. TMP28 TaxID=3397060 RepID=UPI0039DF4828
MAKVIAYGNFKGGTGKTTNSAMMAYVLSKLGYKTLLADLDGKYDIHDKRVMALYTKVTKEMISPLEEIESHKKE